jgi:heme exporter protein D
VEISQFFINGDIKGAIAYMRDHEEFKDILPAYVAIFENCEYRTFDIPDKLNDILRLYQVYYRDTFYCGVPEAEAADRLLAQLRALLHLPDAEEALLAERLQSVFEAEGYHALFGKTQGYYGPYIWRETVPTVYQVQLPDGTAEYTVNILKGFIFRSWMDYLTFGRYGTGGWASPDGTINCIQQAYDFASERFLVSLLKHEAQHTVDMKRFPEITPAELEYRAKLVELHYSGDVGLLQKFLSEADESKAGDSHATASAKIKREFADTDQESLSCIQARARELFHAHTKEMEEKYNS